VVGDGGYGELRSRGTEAGGRHCGGDRAEGMQAAGVDETVGSMQTGYPTYKLQAKIRSRVCVHALLCVLWYWTQSPRSGGL
jgi:hypothetical protein